MANSAEDKELVAEAEVLARILGQDIERDEHGPRLKQGVAPDRLISVHDPEMRHGLIPVLCRKAAIPEQDARGDLTSHRARSTIASQIGQRPRAEGNLIRLRQDLYLTEEEQAVIDDDVAAYRALRERNWDIPTPAGPTPHQLASGPQTQPNGTAN